MATSTVNQMPIGTSARSSLLSTITSLRTTDGRTPGTRKMLRLLWTPGKAEGLHGFVTIRQLWTSIALVLLRAEGLADLNLVDLTKDALGKDKGNKGKGNSGPTNLVQTVACDCRR